jgi:SAM-dependent methyltransferase
VTVPLREVVKWVRRGKSVHRALMNAWLRQRPALKGRVLDLGGGGKPSYLDVLQLDGARFFNMDMLLEAGPSFAGTLERELPVAPGTIDTVLLFNTLEHVYDFRSVAAEMHRVLKSGGNGLIYVPFMFNFHTHKGASFYIDDYFRYTESALGRIFKDAGFSEVHATPLGGYGLVLADLLNYAIPFHAVRAMNAWILGTMQRIAARRRPFLIDRYPLGYSVELRK